MPESRQRAHAAGLATIAITLLGWSSVPLFLRHFASDMDAWTSNGWRYGFAALLWAPVVAWGLRARSLPRGIFRAALVPGIVNSIGQVFFTWAHYKIDPGLLTFGLRTQILFVAAGAYLLFPQERRLVRTPMFWLGVALVLSGTGGTILLGGHPPRLGQLAGIAMAITAGVFFASYSVSVRYYMSAYPSVTSFAVISQYTALAMVGLMLGIGDKGGARPLDLPGTQLTLLLLSSVIGIALGHVAYYISIKRLGVAASSGVLQIQPICVATASYFLFHEVLTVAQWMSGALAVTGAVVILMVEQRISREPVGELEPAGA